ncbi:hypothetical protein ASG73_04190 [Janibacter sp. Soil728]|uniref:condensation domain-containing protein n=1 Tax=Janibacter sp. Soil728 TaxID=1736393 RepID=UPI0006F9367C|nr:condensation domain-containing protein [Janibacter sp. Soil728]KRE39517.1 hypothetical protein ASG73_04190 [Janibacter sp. Soil728]
MTPCTLARQALLGGEVTRWDLDITSLEHWNDSPLDLRPPSHDQLCRLHEDPDGSNPWSAWIGLSVLLPDATTESVERTLTEWFRQHEALRSHLTLVDEQPRRRTLAPEHVGFAPFALGEHDPQALRELLTQEFHTRCRPTRRPACALFTVEVQHGHVLHAAFDHITFDGLSAYAAIGHIAGLHTAVINEVHRPHTSPSHVDLAATEIAVCEAIDADDERLGPWREFLRDGRIPAAPAASGIDPDGSYDHDLVRHDICSGEVAAALALQYAAEGIPTGMLWTAILMQALGDETHVLMSTHGRPSSLWSDSVGWFAGVAPLSLSMPTDCDTSAWVLEGVRVWREVAPSAALPLGLVHRLLDVPVTPQVVLSIIDGSRIEGHEWWQPLGSSIQLGDVPTSSQTHIWLTIVPEGVTLATRLPLAPGARDWLDAAADRFSRLVESATATPFALHLEVPA